MNKWSWKIGRIANIDVRVHATFSLLLLWVAVSVLMAGGSAAATASALLFTLLVFATVVLHELGHALTARVFGIPTREILLLPIGGVARLEGMPKNPKQELLVALAGPAVNVALAIALGVLMAVTGTRFDASADALSQSLLVRMFGVNVALALFNLIPAFPLDGGRVLRALLALRLAPLRATEWAASVGRALAVVFGVAGLFYSPMLLFIGIFVWFAAGAEVRAARAQVPGSEWRTPGMLRPQERVVREGMGTHAPDWRGASGSARPSETRVATAYVVVMRPSWPPAR